MYTTYKTLMFAKGNSVSIYLVAIYCFLLTPLILSGQEPAQFGFSWTQDNIFISKTEGSDLANIHLYGWGSLWPFPDGQPGEFDDGSIIDGRINAAVADGQDVMITIATAPSNFRASGEPWNLEEKVSPEHEDAYIQRVKEFLKDRMDVQYVQVWNEFKGYWNAEENRWDFEAYTKFYNKVFAGVKEVREDILVGGGYVAIRERGFDWDQLYNGVKVDSRDMDAMFYWMENAVGFDAVCIDGDFSPESYPKLTEYLKSLEASKGKPIWWSEFYAVDATMQECAIAIASNLEPGDKSIWWAEQRFLPFINPLETTTNKAVEPTLDFAIFPNPSTTEINVLGSFSESQEYRLYSLDGALKKSGLLHPGNNKLQLSGITNGTYILEIGNATKKLIKMN